MDSTSNQLEGKLAEFQRGDDRLVVAFKEYNGVHYLDARVFFTGRDGVARPTRKGITIRLSEIHNFHDAIGKAIELAEKVRR